ncbi:MAG: hypothetical protein ACFFDV_04675 [Candidatus Thorarchaeota archaeon]
MGKHSDDKRLNTEEGIIVEGSIDILRGAAEKVLFEFNEFLIKDNGEKKPFDGKVKMGDTILFEEDIKPCPAQIVVVKVAENLWYVISTSQVPKGGYPSGVEAMRAAQAEEKKIRMIKEFLSKTAGRDKVKDVRNWQPDMRAEAADVLSIINSATRKWRH